MRTDLIDRCQRVFILNKVNRAGSPVCPGSEFYLEIKGKEEVAVAAQGLTGAGPWRTLCLGILGPVAPETSFSHSAGQMGCVTHIHTRGSCV